MIEFKPGQVYNPEHLRPFNLQLALQGHPLASVNGFSVRYLRLSEADWFMWDAWAEKSCRWLSFEAPTVFAGDSLRLAPLAIKDDRPLHVRDEIEWRASIAHPWQSRNVGPSEAAAPWDYVRTYYGRDWRWPKESN